MTNEGPEQTPDSPLRWWVIGLPDDAVVTEEQWNAPSMPPDDTLPPP